MARRHGADEVIMLGADLYKEAARITGGRSPQRPVRQPDDPGWLSTWSTTASASPARSRTLCDWARAGGCVVMVGVYLEPMKIDLTPVWYWEVDLIGVLAHGAEDWQGERVSTFELIARLMREGKMNVDGFITHRFTLPEYRKAIATAIQQPRTHSIKVVFDYR